MKKSLLIIAAIALMATACTNNEAGKTETATTTETTAYTPAKVIDFEHHLYLKEFIDYLRTRTDYPMYNNQDGIVYAEGAFLALQLPLNLSHCPMHEGLPILDIMADLGDGRITAMDYAGVSTAALSTSGGIEMNLPREDAVKYARMINDAVAEAAKKYPDRFIGTICLPMPYVEESVAELERAVKKLGLKYWHTHSNYCNHFLYEPQFEPVLAKCAELGVAFYVHPTSSTETYLTDSGTGMSSAGFAYGVDVMKTAMRIVLNGTFDRYPNLRMILGHMAEYFPYTLDRMNNRVFLAKGFDPFVNCEHDFTYYFKNMNIMMTTSGIFDPKVVTFAIDEIGIDNILLGSDYPYEDFKAAVDFIKNLPISNEDKDKIMFKNAEKYILK